MLVKPWTWLDRYMEITSNHSIPNAFARMTVKIIQLFDQRKKSELVTLIKIIMKIVFRQNWIFPVTLREIRDNLSALSKARRICTIKFAHSDMRNLQTIIQRTKIDFDKLRAGFSPRLTIIFNWKIHWRPWNRAYILVYLISLRIPRLTSNVQ
jgi:hypothetical protein